MSPSILKNENLQGREKTIFTIFYVAKFFEKINWSKMMSIMSKCQCHLCSLTTDPEIQHGILNMVKKEHCFSLKAKKSLCGMDF